ncbi:MAG: hypothetical protein D6785_01300, partial [Planctomycetota bacterium]
MGKKFFLNFLFFLSGFAGLVHQIIWMRRLQYILGALALAMGIVLAAYMAGLALGSWFFGRKAQNLSNPIAAYGWLEMGIGLFAFNLIWIFPLLDRITFVMGETFFVSSSGHLLFSGLVSLLVLFFPTFCMGGTFPLLAEISFNEKDVAYLYTINTLGGALGVLASGFLFLPFLGMGSSLLLASCCNLLVAYLAWQNKDLREESQASESKIEKKESSLSSSKPSFLTLFSPFLLNQNFFFYLLPAFFMGIAFFLLEICWARVMALLLGSSIYGSTVMVFTVLLALGIGAFLASRFFNTSKIRQKGLVIFLFLGLSSTLGTLYLYFYLPFLFIKLFFFFQNSLFALPLKFAISGMVIFFPSLFLGTIFL